MSLGQFLQAYYLGRDGGDQEEAKLDEGTDGKLLVTGDELIDSIYNAIRLRRPVLVTGPRGCGKSYCAEQAIRLAAHQLAAESPHQPRLKQIQSHTPNPIIGGWHFLQGNREIPREYLTEDVLVIGDDKRPDFQRALLLRGRSGKHPAFPGIPVKEVGDLREAMKEWDDSDWNVLYLDEVNRFGDGFLDALLSLTEEGKIVRRGVEYYVPIIVVATANPPGYDVTAKKLSPPLQARIARSFRISQPPVETLVKTVLEAMKNRIQKSYGTAPEIPERKFNSAAAVQSNRATVELVITGEQLRLAAAATLCMWGDPDKKLSGHYYLIRETREQLRFAVSIDAELAAAMRALTRLIVFGPDSRAAADWLAAAAGAAYNEWEKAGKPAPRHDLAFEHFRNTALEVLAHKVRESFNEGTEPDKTVAKERYIDVIVSKLFADGARRGDQVLWSPVQRLFLGERGLEADFGSTAGDALKRFTDERRRPLWQFALATAPAQLFGSSPAQAAAQDTVAVRDPVKRWVHRQLVRHGLLERGGTFVGTERQQLQAFFEATRPSEASQMIALIDKARTGA